MSDQSSIPYLPRDLNSLDVAFGGSAMEILPPWDKIPEEFKRQSNPWVKWQQRWFFEGLNRRPVPREGVDVNAAIRSLSCVQGSFHPKHEHKEAGVAYLASLWFDSPDGEPIPPRIVKAALAHKDQKP